MTKKSKTTPKLQSRISSRRGRHESPISRLRQDCSGCCCTCIPPTHYDLSSATKIVNKCKIKRRHLLLCLTRLRSTENHSLRSIWGKKNRFLLIKEASLQPFDENATLRHWYLKHMTWLGSPKKIALAKKIMELSSIAQIEGCMSPKCYRQFIFLLFTSRLSGKNSGSLKGVV